MFRIVLDYGRLIRADLLLFCLGLAKSDEEDGKGGGGSLSPSCGQESEEASRISLFGVE